MTNYNNCGSNLIMVILTEITKSSYKQNLPSRSRISVSTLFHHELIELSWLRRNETLWRGEQKRRISSRQRSIPLIKVWCVRETRRRQKTSAGRSRHTVYWYVMRMDWELITRILNRKNVSISIRDCAGLAALSVLLRISFKRKKIYG